MPGRDEYYSLQATGEVGGNTSATQFPSLAGVRMVKVKARTANTGDVYIGLSGVTAPDGSDDQTTGYELSPGDESPWIPLDGNLDDLYRICDNAGDDVTFIALG